MIAPASSSGDAMEKNYRIPLVWQMYGHVNVTAASMEEAIDYALGPDCPLPDGDYVDESAAVDEETLNTDNL